MDALWERTQQQTLLKLIAAGLPEGAGIVRDYVTMPGVVEFDGAAVTLGSIVHMLDVQFPSLEVAVEWTAATGMSESTTVKGVPPQGLPMTLSFSLLSFALAFSSRISS